MLQVAKKWVSTCPYLDVSHNVPSPQDRDGMEPSIKVASSCSAESARNAALFDETNNTCYWSKPAMNASEWRRGLGKCIVRICLNGTARACSNVKLDPTVKAR